jgi:hypothetical protein
LTGHLRCCATEGHGSLGRLLASIFAAVPCKVDPVTETLDQDIQALKDWLRSAWRSLASPSITPFERREIRNYMKEADAALRAGLQKVAARNEARSEGYTKFSCTGVPGFRILKIDT